MSDLRRSMGQDKPILPPQKVLSLRGVDPQECHFDAAALCFRGRRSSELLANYRETPAKIERWQSWGSEFVNLETGPFYAVASFLGMRAVYLAW